MANFSDQEPDGSASAGNGLLSRRQWLRLGTGGAAASLVAPVWAAGGTSVEPWRSGSGAPPSPSSAMMLKTRARANSLSAMPCAGAGSKSVCSMNSHRRRSGCRFLYRAVIARGLPADPIASLLWSAPAPRTTPSSLQAADVARMATVFSPDMGNSRA